MRFDIPQLPEERPGDPETRMVEAIANNAYMLRVFRTRVETEVRADPDKLAPVLGGVVPNAESLELALLEFAGRSSSFTAGVAVADLLHRADGWDDADRFMAYMRDQYASLTAEDAADPVGWACTQLVEGDWYATPGSCPEALGFDLATQTIPSPFLDRRDLARAAAAYERAADSLAGVEEPRAHGALALRRAALAWLAGDHVAQKELLASATASFEAAGDAAFVRLTAVHGLLADIALGRIAATRSEAGTRFDLRARGPIEEVLRWGESDGSVGWTTGLGRLFQRAAARWDADGDYERAAVAYELAAPLVPASGAESPASVVLEHARLDRAAGFGVRGLTRCRSAIAALPPVANAAREMLAWQQSMSAVQEVVLAQLDARSTAAGMNVAALEWACDRIRRLLTLPGVPREGEPMPSEPAPGTAGDPIDEMAASPRFIAQLAGMADVARGIIALGEFHASSRRAQQAAAVGANATADLWCDDALRKLAALPALVWPAAVGLLAARERIDEARARLRTLLDAPDLSADALAAAAVCVFDYETALRLFGPDTDAERAWTDVIEHAEAALGAGRIELAVTLTERAVRDFEARFGRLRRDVDRISVTDNVDVARLFLLAARVQLARAERFEPDASAAVRARAFELSDRARALALEALLADASGHTDDEALIRAARGRTAEWQAAHERLYRAYATAAADEEVAARIAELASAEDALVAVEAELDRAERAAPRSAPRSEPVSLADVQAALPPGAALIEYQLVGRDLLVWTITRTTADAAASRHPIGEIARLAKAVQRACTNGAPGPEADELAGVLFDPAAAAVGGCERLIVVPYGPLNGLPFHVLPVGGHALGETHVLSYLPAAALLPAAGVDEPLAGRRALVVGDPAFDAALHPELDRLPGAAVEADAVAATYGVPALIGPDAEEPTVRRRLADCDVVHLAAHGRLDPVAPSDSSIVLAGPDELTVSDLVGLRIDSELAVLSACDSGRGAASLGNDVVGLARGLIAAGARRSVVTLWPVDDAPACVTMSLFHERLAIGMPVAGALHAAQNDVRAMSGAQLWARYAALGGADEATRSTRRRGAPASRAAAEHFSLDPEFADELDDAGALDGDLARVWAPFVVIGG
jgi:CHAT domain-containing protein